MKITFSWTAIRCQKFDETVEESIPLDEEPPVTVPSSSTDWCDDADAWNSDDDDNNNNNEKKSSSIPTTMKKEIKKEPEVVMLNSMKIEDENENENEKSSSDEDDDGEIEVETKKKSNNKNISVASSDAFNEWKKANLNKQTLDISTNASFPFYYIVIDDEESIINEAKFNENKKLKNKMKKLGDIDEDDDEITKGGKEYVFIMNLTKKFKLYFFRKYEKTPDIEHGDVVFYRFQQKIRYAPDQIIR
jgi:hypothetical protein